VARRGCRPRARCAAPGPGAGYSDRRAARAFPGAAREVGALSLPHFGESGPSSANRVPVSQPDHPCRPFGDESDALRGVLRGPDARGKGSGSPNHAACDTSASGSRTIERGCAVRSRSGGAPAAGRSPRSRAALGSPGPAAAVELSGAAQARLRRASSAGVAAAHLNDVLACGDPCEIAVARTGGSGYRQVAS
jgi:hypothetical protein